MADGLQEGGKKLTIVKGGGVGSGKAIARAKSKFTMNVKGQKVVKKAVSHKGKIRGSKDRGAKAHRGYKGTK